jgi:hypothetical protein
MQGASWHSHKESASAAQHCIGSAPAVNPVLALRCRECQGRIFRPARSSPYAREADKEDVRGLSPLINILLTCVAAGAVAPVLGMPWFGAAVDSNDGHQGQVELMGEAFGRWFTTGGDTTTGADALNGLETALLAVVAASALLALAMLIPPLRSSLRGSVKLVPLAAPLIVLIGIVVEAGPAGVEPRRGAFVALALTVFLVSAAQQAAEMREKKKPVPKPYSPGAAAR